MDKLLKSGFESFILRSKFCFSGTVSGCFSQCKFKTFRRRPTMVIEIFGQPPHQEKASYGPETGK